MHEERTRAVHPLGRWLRWLGWSAVAALLMTAFLAPANALSVNAPGNNGTVKIHDGATETEPIVHNEPHVCTFHLHFFFADPFQSGSWWIEQWAPGAKGQVVLSGTYDTNGSGQDRQPEQGAYSLPDGHYKLFWTGDPSRLLKMKVFWVDCAAASASPILGSTQAPGTETPSGSPGESSAASPGESAVESPGESVSGAVSSPTEAPSFESTQAPATEVPTGSPSESSAASGATSAVAAARAASPRMARVGATGAIGTTSPV